MPAFNFNVPAAGAGLFTQEDLSDCVEEFATGTYLVTRSGPTVRLKGRVQPQSAPTVFPVLGMLAPLKGLGLDRLPEGLRNKEVMAFFSPTMLQTVDTSNEPDVIAAEGVQWEVQSQVRWFQLGRFYTFLVARRPP